MAASSWQRGRGPEETRLRGELQHESGGVDTGEDVREDVLEETREGVSLQCQFSLPKLYVVDSVSERRLTMCPEERGIGADLASACVTFKSPIAEWRSYFTYRTL